MYKKNFLNYILNKHNKINRNKILLDEYLINKKKKFQEVEKKRKKNIKIYFKDKFKKEKFFFLDSFLRVLIRKGKKNFALNIIYSIINIISIKQTNNNKLNIYLMLEKINKYLSTTFYHHYGLKITEKKSKRDGRLLTFFFVRTYTDKKLQNKKFNLILKLSKLHKNFKFHYNIANELYETSQFNSYSFRMIKEIHNQILRRRKFNLFKNIEIFNKIFYVQNKRRKKKEKVKQKPLSLKFLSKNKFFLMDDEEEEEDEDDLNENIMPNYKKKKIFLFHKSEDKNFKEKKYKNIGVLKQIKKSFIKKKKNFIFLSYLKFFKLENKNFNNFYNNFNFILKKKKINKKNNLKLIKKINFYKFLFFKKFFFRYKFINNLNYENLEKLKISDEASGFKIADYRISRKKSKKKIERKLKEYKFKKIYKYIDGKYIENYRNIYIERTPKLAFFSIPKKFNKLKYHDFRSQYRVDLNKTKKIPPLNMDFRYYKGFFNNINKLKVKKELTLNNKDYFYFVNKNFNKKICDFKRHFYLFGNKNKSIRNILKQTIKWKNKDKKVYEKKKQYLKKKYCFFFFKKQLRKLKIISQIKKLKKKNNIFFIKKKKNIKKFKK